MTQSDRTEKKKLRVLFAEDSIEDYELIVDKLTRAGLKIISKRVETASEFENILKSEDWDVILSDNSLPSFNAREALMITRAYDVHIPFIIVSRTIGEESAVKAMKSGASDYIIKDNLTRLVPAIHRELIDYEHQQKTKAKLKKSQEYYQLLAQNVQDLVCVYNNKGMYSWVSPSSKKILGYIPDEMLSSEPFSRTHPNDLDRIQNRIFQSILDGNLKEVQRYKYRSKRKDGVYIHLETLAEPIYENGQLYKIVSTSRDITEQVLATDLLEENQAKYESVLECLSEGIILLDGNGRVLASNKSAQEQLSLPHSENKTLIEIIFERFKIVNNDRKEEKAKDFFLRDTVKTGQPQFNKTYLLKRGYKEKWLSFNCVPYIINDESQGVVLSFMDITEVYKNEEKLNRLAKELVILIETANAPIFGIDQKGNITEWNTFASNITGYSKQEATTKNLFEDLILMEDRDKVYDIVLGIVEDNVSESYELPIITKSGKLVTILFSGSTRRDYDNKIVGIVCVGQDVTELIEYRHQLEYKVEERTAELKKALDKEKELVQLKSKFVSMASHEFRTPLSTIKFAADFVKKYHEKTDWSKLEVKLDKINEQIKHMTYLLDDVLMMGKSEAGKIKIEKNPLQLSEFCDNIIEEVKNLTNNSHEIDFSLSSNIKYVSTDEKLLRNIFINLLNNAIKFSPEKNEVKFDVTYLNGLMTVIVQDWGIGISDEDSEKVYEAFHRSDSVAGIHGTGLGLSIVKKAVELQNGIIKHESKLNQGTIFTVKIPLEHEEGFVS